MAPVQVQDMRARGISPNTWLYNAQIQVSLRVSTAVC